MTLQLTIELLLESNVELSGYGHKELVVPDVHHNRQTPGLADPQWCFVFHEKFSAFSLVFLALSFLTLLFFLPLGVAVGGSIARLPTQGAVYLSGFNRSNRRKSHSVCCFLLTAPLVVSEISYHCTKL